MENKNEFRITRVFDAPRHLVWKAHTEVERMLRWWGPKGFIMKAARLDLRPGGMFHYGMQSPDGQTMWGKLAYREIKPEEKLVFVTSFSNENGEIVRHPISPTWPLEILNTITFKEHDGKTTLIISGYPINASAEEQDTYNNAHQGMQQGFKGTFDQLDEYLLTLNKTLNP